MKYLIILMAPILFVSCASGPIRILVRNCKSMGGGIYTCEKIPEKEVEPRK